MSNSEFISRWKAELKACKKLEGYSVDGEPSRYLRLAAKHVTRAGDYLTEVEQFKPYLAEQHHGSLRTVADEEWDPVRESQHNGEKELAKALYLSDQIQSAQDRGLKKGEPPLTEELDRLNEDLIGALARYAALMRKHQAYGIIGSVRHVLETAEEIYRKAPGNALSVLGRNKPGDEPPENLPDRDL